MWTFPVLYTSPWRRLGLASMSYLRTVTGSDAFRNASDPSTWNITLRLERHPKYLTEASSSQLHPYEFEGWDAKASALGLRADLAERDTGKQFLQAIEKNDIWAASHLRSKIEAARYFPFRVLTQDGGIPPQRGEGDNRASFLCLSYRWWSDSIEESWGKGRFLSPALRVDGYHGNFDIPKKKFPVSDCMWNVLLAERSSEREGIWVDQMCINQDDDVEVHSTVSSMNLLYMAARKIVVVMEDVLLWSDEARALIKHAQQINSVPAEARNKWTPWTTMANPLTLGASACALFKIEGSTWFRRVWCNHELQMGSQHIFVIPVMEREPPPEGVDAVCILKLDSKALATLIEASRRVAGPEDLEGFLYRGWLDNIQEDMHVGNEPRVFYGFNAATNFSKKVATPERTLIYKANGWPSIQRTAMEILAEVLTFEEANPRDVLAVLLNTLYPALAYRGQEVPTIPEIVWLVTMAALAAGDVSPLLHPCQPDSWRNHTIADIPDKRYSWAAWPDEHHVSARTGFAQGISVKHQILDEGLKLVVAASGSSDAITQLQESQSQLEDSPIYGFLHKVLLFDRLTRLHERKLKESRSDKKDVDKQLNVHPSYFQHFVHAYLSLMSLDEQTRDAIASELSKSNLLKGPLEAIPDFEALQSLPEAAALIDDGDAEQFSEMRDSYTEHQPLMDLAEAVVQILIGHEYQFRDKDFNPGVFISIIHGANPEREWKTLAGLPSKAEHGFYWLVRPDAVVEAYPLVDFRFGGTWAVQVEGKDAAEAQSMDIWNKTGYEEANSQKDLEDDVLRSKLISRNIRFVPAETWDRPLFTKTVIVYA